MNTEKIEQLRQELDDLIESLNFCMTDFRIIDKAKELENLISNR